jgi:carboxypeptidase Taq
MAHDPAAPDLAARSAELADLGYVLSLLYWDQRTKMPAGGLEARGHQIATIESLIHERTVDSEYGKLLQAAASAADGRDDESAGAYRVAQRRRRLAKRLPGDFVAELARAASESVGVWSRARAESDFAGFAPNLEVLIDLQRRKAEYLGYEDDPYDALVDLYEPGMTTARINELFAPLRQRLAALLERIRPFLHADPRTVLHGEFDPDRQVALTRAVIEDLGYDFGRGRQDLTVHPFAVSVGAGDVRVTLRTEDDYLGLALFASIHEAGHAMHSQGVPVSLSRTALADCESLVVCESQSRLWENLIGRSRPYSDRLLRHLREHFPRRFESVTAERLYRDVNRVGAGHIRVEADELHYNLHVILRFEIEQDLIAGRLAVADIPDRWAELSRELLGVTPPDDARGCLQDVHWSQAAMGYFPTYTLGNLLAAQLHQAALSFDPAIDSACRRGEYSGLLSWMREHVHRHGSKWNATELAHEELGQELSAEPLLEYLECKFEALYLPKSQS